MSYDERLSLLEIPSLSQRRQYLDLKFTHKILNNRFNISPGDLGIQRLTSKSRGNQYNLCVRRANKSVIGKSYTFRIAKQWNNLPLVVKARTNHSAFVTDLVKHCY